MPINKIDILGGNLVLSLFIPLFFILFALKLENRISIMGKKKSLDLPVLRQKINGIDSDIIKLLSERKKLSKEVILAKEKGHSPIRDQKREADLLDRLIKTGKKAGLDAHFVSKLFYEIISNQFMDSCSENIITVISNN